MHAHHLQNKVNSLQQQKLVAAVEATAITLFAVVTAALLPQLIYSYLVESNPAMLEQTLALQYLPHGAYAVAAIAFIVAMVGNWKRTRQIRALNQELMVAEYTDDGCCGECGHHHHDDDAEMMSAPVKNSESAMATAMAKTAKKTKTASASKTRRTSKK